MGELQPFEFVITLIIADLATIPMAEINIPLVHGVIPLLTLSLLHYLISVLARKSIFARKIINGKPVIVISPNGIEYDNLKKLNMNLDDLIEAMRETNYFSFEDIRYGIIETNGKLTVLPKANVSPITSQDLKLKKQETYLPITLISGGKIINENLKYTKLKKEYLLEKLEENNINSIKNIVILSVDEGGQVFVQEQQSEPKTFKINYKGEYVWEELFGCL